jgi:hypothetical protein
LYGAYDNCEHTDHCGEYDYKGLYKVPPKTPGTPLRTNESGVAWRTMSRNLRHKKYDEIESGKLNLPLNVDGGAFASQDGQEYTYVLWAKTSKDRDETASSIYTFPSWMNVVQMTVMAWDETETTIVGNTVHLTGTPVLIRLNTRAQEIIHVQSVSINPVSLIPVYEGKIMQFIATVLPANAKIKTVTWSSDDPAVATINHVGQFTAVKTGKTTIRATSHDGLVAAVCPVEVTKEPIGLSYIMIEPSWTSLHVDATFQLKLTIIPAETTNKQMIWSSSNERVAKVDQNGLVTAIAKGDAGIIVTPVAFPEKAKAVGIRVE